MSLNIQLSVRFMKNSEIFRGMKIIWYLLKCPEGYEMDYEEKYHKLVNQKDGPLREVIRFQYQRLIRYGGGWHLERRILLPGHLFLSKNDEDIWEYDKIERYDEQKDVSIMPCESPFVKDLCSKDGLIEMSKGVIQNGVVTVTSGPLKCREHLIRRLDRHKRTADIEIPFQGQKMRVTLGLEIYAKTDKRF